MARPAAGEQIEEIGGGEGDTEYHFRGKIYSTRAAANKAQVASKTKTAAEAKARAKTKAAAEAKARAKTKAAAEAKVRAKTKALAKEKSMAKEKVKPKPPVVKPKPPVVTPKPPVVTPKPKTPVVKPKTPVVKPISKLAIESDLGIGSLPVSRWSPVVKPKPKTPVVKPKPVEQIKVIEGGDNWDAEYHFRGKIYSTWEAANRARDEAIAKNKKDTTTPPR